MFRKKDIVLIAVIIVTAALSALLTMFVQRGAGDMIRISADGKLYGEYSLSEDQTVVIDRASGYNRLVIENGSAYMAEADCPDKYCMDYNPISKGGETIVCLPHKLVVEVMGAHEARQPDVIVP